MKGIYQGEIWEIARLVIWNIGMKSVWKNVFDYLQEVIILSINIFNYLTFRFILRYVIRHSIDIYSYESGWMLKWHQQNVEKQKKDIKTFKIDCAL